MIGVKKIKALMGANDHSRKFVAEYLGISNTALANKLNGVVEFKASELKKIAELYGITVDELYK